MDQRPDGDVSIMKVSVMFRGTLSLIAIGLIISCGHSHEIAGKWRTLGSGPSMVWEFGRDGSFTQGTVRGRYNFGDNERIKVQTPFATAVYRMQLAGDRLTLIDGHGTKLEFTRAKEE
jgi:hypothetical protein